MKGQRDIKDIRDIRDEKGMKAPEPVFLESFGSFMSLRSFMSLEFRSSSRGPIAPWRNLMKRAIVGSDRRR
jgi:hypothetical protein